MMDQNKNYFIAIGLSVLILIAWQFLYVNPKIEEERLRQEALQQEQTAQQTPQSDATGTDTPAAGTGALAAGCGGATPEGVAPLGTFTPPRTRLAPLPVTINRCTSCCRI